MTAPTILIVDDDPDTALIAQMALCELTPFEVVVASRGEQAIRWAAVLQPLLILMDVVMPGLDGVAAHQRLRADPRTASIPVIYMTARAQPRQRLEYLAAGAAGIIPKPFDPMKLAAQIDTILELGPGEAPVRRPVSGNWGQPQWVL